MLAERGRRRSSARTGFSLAREAADEVAVLDGDVILERGTLTEVLADPKRPRIRALLGRFL